MLALSYVALRFIHFAALMLLFRQRALQRLVCTVFVAAPHDPAFPATAETRGLNQPDGGSADVWPAKWVDGQRLGRCHSSGGLAQRAGNAIWRRLVVANGAGRCDGGRCMAYPAKRLTAVTARDGAAGAVGGRGTCRDERWRTGSIASSQPCASSALRRDLGWVVYCRCCFVCVWRKAAGSQPLSLP